MALLMIFILVAVIAGLIGWALWMKDSRDDARERISVLAMERNEWKQKFGEARAVGLDIQQRHANSHEIATTLRKKVSTLLEEIAKKDALLLNLPPRHTWNNKMPLDKCKNELKRCEDALSKITMGRSIASIRVVTGTKNQENLFETVALPPGFSYLRDLAEQSLRQYKQQLQSRIK